MKTLTKTNLRIGSRKVGKVRDIYETPNQIRLITTDRQSAFDKNLTSIPHKGQVLNKMSLWWFRKTQHIVPNHVISSPNGNSLICKRCQPFPIEFVVRGYLTGSTSTSIYTHYSSGERDYCGHNLPDGLVRNQKLQEIIVTPTTKGVKDELISSEEIVERKLMTEKDWNYCEKKSLELFKFGQHIAAKKGFILVDTKYEFGKSRDGKILLIDEIHTPDSSRYWVKDSYLERFEAGQEPERFDKDVLREWYKKQVDPYSDETIKIPNEIRLKLSQRYINIYESITGNTFVDDLFPQPEETLRYTLDRKAVIIMGSLKDKPWADKITNKLSDLGVLYDIYVGSAHKNPRQVLDIIDTLQKQQTTIVYIAVVGLTNGLGPFVAANTNFPVLTCPVFKDKTDMLINIHSSLQMPSMVPLLTILNPENCALAAHRILNIK